TRVLGRRGRPPARRRLSPGRGCRRGRGPAHDRARALHRLDAGAAMIDALGAWADLLPRLAWPWMLLALPAPWLARRWLPPVRHALPALRVPWSQRIEDLVARGESVAVRGMPPLARLAWGLLCLAAARPQQPGGLRQPPAAGRALLLAGHLSGRRGDAAMGPGAALGSRL